MSQEITRYLCFSLGSEEFAMPLLSVREVIGVPEFTPIPQAPSYYLGMMNLRGQVISVIDLRTKLGVKGNKSAETSVVIIDLGENSMGLMVDSVNSVLTPTAENISAPPDLAKTPASEFVTSVYRKEDHLILVLDILKVLSREDRHIAARSAA